jgi:hypothetical protein
MESLVDSWSYERGLDMAAESQFVIEIVKSNKDRSDRCKEVTDVKQQR